jgi:hypothetical protein
LKYSATVKRHLLVEGKGEAPSRLLLIVEKRGLKQAIPLHDKANGEFFPVGCRVEIRTGPEGCQVTRLEDA